MVRVFLWIWLTRLSHKEALDELCPAACLLNISPSACGVLQSLQKKKSLFSQTDKMNVLGSYTSPLFHHKMNTRWLWFCKVGCDLGLAYMLLIWNIILVSKYNPYIIPNPKPNCKLFPKSERINSWITVI